MKLIPKCPKCGSFDLSIYLENNKIKCSICGYTGKSSKEDLDEYMRDLIDKEKESNTKDPNSKFL